MENKNKEENKNVKPEETETAVPENETDSEAENMEKEVIKEVDELKDKLMRTMAEFDNFKKRSQKEKDALYSLSVAQTVEKFLPVLDTLKLSVAHKTEDENFKKGVEMTIRQFEEALSKLGVTETPGAGSTFDPNFHNAVMHIEDDKYKEQEVVEVLQTGYMLKDNVIRFAMVKVAN